MSRNANALLDAKGLQRYDVQDLRGEMNQLKALIDLCHIYGLAVILDVVYNHAGGDFGDQSMYFFDRQSTAGGNGNSLYFTDRGHAGGLVFDYGKPEVRDFLIQNAKFFLNEYRVDGFRYDQVSVIDHDGAPNGWGFCQDLTNTLHEHRPGAMNKAEYWDVNPYVVKAPQEGAGFDTTLTDGLRIAIRDVIGNASAPDERPLNMTGLARSLWPDGFAEEWRFVQGPENQDIVYVDREQRVARLGDPGNPRSWYGRSRARVATGISLTAPGIPMLFMGQEFLEDKQWSDNLDFHKDLLLYWAGLDTGDKQMLDHLRFTRELLALRWQLSGTARAGLPRGPRARRESRAGLPPLGGRRGPGRAGGGAPLDVQSLRLSDRLPGRRRVARGLQQRRVRKLGESGRHRQWRRRECRPDGRHGFDISAALTLPANSLLVFAR